MKPFQLTAEVIGNALVNLAPQAMGTMVELSDQPALERITYSDTASPAAGKAATSTQPSKIAVVNIRGPLEQRATEHLCGITDGYDAIYSRFVSALERQDVAAVLLSIDSPGGHTHGNIENARAMRAAKEKYGKPVIAFADEHACSAAFAIACVADEIYAPRSGRLGSIGTRTMHADHSKEMDGFGVAITEFASGGKKLLGTPYRPLSDEDRASIQGRVDDLGRQFEEWVAEARGLEPAAVKALEAAAFSTAEAVERGLADGEKTFAEVAALMVERVQQVAEQAKNNEESMSLEAIQKMLGVDNPEAAVKAVASLQENAASAKALSDKVEVLTSKLKDLDDAKAAAERDAEVDAEISKGEAEGKITPARKEGLIAKAKKHGVEWLRDHLEEAVVVMHATSVESSTRDATKHDAELQAAFDRFGITQEEIDRAKKLGARIPNRTE